MEDFFSIASAIPDVHPVLSRMNLLSKDTRGMFNILESVYINPLVVQPTGY